MTFVPSEMLVYKITYKDGGENRKRKRAQKHKSSEGEFIFAMLHEYELSPKESESILETAKTLFDSRLDQGSLPTHKGILINLNEN